MMERLGAALGTDPNSLKCVAMVLIAGAMMWPHRHAGLLYWSVRSLFTLAIAMCFPRFRAAAKEAVAHGVTLLGAGGARDDDGAAAAAVEAAAAEARARQSSAASGVGSVARHRQVETWRWEDAGDAVCITVQLPDASLERDGSGALVPPTATARMMPQDFTLTITTKTADHVLEVKNLFNSIDPRESGTTVDPDSGLVTLRLAKWYDNTKWKSLQDDGAHPLRCPLPPTSCWCWCCCSFLLTTRPRGVLRSQMDLGTLDGDKKSK